MELRDKIVQIIFDWDWKRDSEDSFIDADACADEILSLEPIAQALKLTVVKTMENR